MPKDAVSPEDVQAEAATAVGLFLWALCPLVSLSHRALTALAKPRCPSSPEKRRLRLPGALSRATPTARNELLSLKEQGFSSCLNIPRGKATAQAPTVPQKGNEWGRGTVNQQLWLLMLGVGCRHCGPRSFGFCKESQELLDFNMVAQVLKTNKIKQSKRTHCGAFGGAGGGRRGLHWLGCLSR